MDISVDQLKSWLNQVESFLFARWACIVLSNGLVILFGYLALEVRWNWFLLFDPIKDGIREFLAFGQGTVLGLMLGMACGFTAGLALGVLSLLKAINEKKLR